ncbi:MAG: hypothetical protein AMJ94_04330 [Deltaproteobacteria bacterium SM23_61]|nr:MAG: hypothetical protein AMJ94_04330 [Deltaproteobacteria bacterium SM23_61]
MTSHFIRGQVSRGGRSRRSRPGPLNAASPEWLGVNKKAWDALPPDLQKAFDQALKETRFEEKEWEDAIAWDLRARKRIQELGMTVVDIPKAEIEKARQKSKPVM